MVTQLSIHVTMILLSRTKHPVESGLQSIFQDNQEENENSDTALIFLVLSVLWSFVTASLTSVKIKTEAKNFLPIFPKAVLGIRYLLIWLVRIGSIIAYFSPFIGLVGIMDHFQAETMSLDHEIWQNINNTKNQQFHYWNDITNEYASVHVSELFRANNKINGAHQLVPSTLYTIIELRTAYIIFWIFYLLYGLLLLFIKYCMNEDFKSATFGEKFQHIVEAINMPEAHGDWDVNNELDLDGHFKKWRQILNEMLVMVLLQFVTNLCLLIPFFITGTAYLLYIWGVRKRGRQGAPLNFLENHDHF